MVHRQYGLFAAQKDPEVRPFARLERRALVRQPTLELAAFQLVIINNIVYMSRGRKKWIEALISAPKSSRN